MLNHSDIRLQKARTEFFMRKDNSVATLPDDAERFLLQRRFIIWVSSCNRDKCWSGNWVEAEGLADWHVQQWVRSKESRMRRT